MGISIGEQIPDGLFSIIVLSTVSERKTSNLFSALKCTGSQIGETIHVCTNQSSRYKACMEVHAAVSQTIMARQDHPITQQTVFASTVPAWNLWQICMVAV